MCTSWNSKKQFNSRTQKHSLVLVHAPLLARLVASTAGHSSKALQKHSHVIIHAPLLTRLVGHQQQEDVSLGIHTPVVWWRQVAGQNVVHKAKPVSEAAEQSMPSLTNTN